MAIQIGINQELRTRRIQDEINAERDRRIDAGFEFATHWFDFDPDSVTNITGAGASAGIAIAMGVQPNDLRWANPAADFAWLSADNTYVSMDAHTCFAFSQAAMAHKQTHIFVARALKDMDPIPSDFLDDAYWP